MALWGSFWVVVWATYSSILSKFLADPVWLFKVWDGGMSFHGGAIGVLVAFALFARKTDKRFFTVADFMVPMVPIGLATGRFGNFINAEPGAGPVTCPGPWCFRPTRIVSRHPSQLYECLLEGVVLFIVLWVYSAKPRPAGGGDGPVWGRLRGGTDLCGNSSASRMPISAIWPAGG